MAWDDEVAVTESWREWIRSSAEERTEALARLQAEFVVRGLSLSGSPVRRKYLKLERDLWDAGEGRIQSCVSPTSIDPAESAILVAPHLGYSKLMRKGFARALGASDTLVLDGVPNNEPWLWRHAATYHSAETVLRGREFVPVEIAYRTPVAVLQIQYGAVTVDVDTGGLELIASGLEAHENPVAVSMFPESGTTGKRSTNGGSIHTLEPFHSGFTILAARFGWPILGIAHVVDRTAASHVAVLGPYRLADERHAANAARTIRSEMQGAMSDLLMALG